MRLEAWHSFVNKERSSWVESLRYVTRFDHCQNLQQTGLGGEISDVENPDICTTTLVLLLVGLFKRNHLKHLRTTLRGWTANRER